MPNLPISGLPAGSTLDGTELFAIVQDGVTKYTTLNNILYGKQANNYGLFNQTGSYTGVSASLDESSLIGGGIGTLSVPANNFTQGDAYEATFSGTCTFHNGDELQIRVKADSVVLADTGIITLTRADLERWNLNINFSIHQIGGAGTAIIASSGIFQYTQHASSTFSGRNFGLINSSSFDTTILNTLEVTAQFDHNDNVISTDVFTLRKTY